MPPSPQIPGPPRNTPDRNMERAAVKSVPWPIRCGYGFPHAQYDRLSWPWTHPLVRDKVRKALSPSEASAMDCSSYQIFSDLLPHLLLVAVTTLCGWSAFSKNRCHALSSAGLALTTTFSVSPSYVEDTRGICCSSSGTTSCSSLHLRPFLHRPRANQMHFGASAELELDAMPAFRARVFG